MQAAAAGFTLIERLPQYHAGNNLVGWQLLLHRPCYLLETAR